MRERWAPEWKCMSQPIAFVFGVAKIEAKNNKIQYKLFSFLFIYNNIELELQLHCYKYGSPSYANTFTAQTYPYINSLCLHYKTSHYIRFVVYVCPDSKRSFALHILFYLNYTKLQHNKMQLIKPLDQKIYHRVFFFVPLLEI